MGTTIRLPDPAPKLLVGKRYAFECTVQDPTGDWLLLYVSHAAPGAKNPMPSRPACPSARRKTNGECCPPGFIALESGCASHIDF